MLLKEKKEKHNLTKQLLEKKTIPIVNYQYKEDAIKELNILHGNKDGFVTIATKKDKVFYQWHQTVEELNLKAQNFMKTEDVYISMNSFWTTLRRLTTIRHLNCFYVDLDYYNVKNLKDKTTEEMIIHLREKNLFEKVGEPSFFMDSGKGMYIVWLIKDCSRHMLPLWQVIQNKIYGVFEKFGADKNALDATRVLKWCGTISGKTGRRARFIYNSKKHFLFEQEQEEMRVYTIQEMSDKLLDKLPYDKAEWKKIKAKKIKTKLEKRQCKIKSLLSLHSLHYARMKDILKLVELRKGDCEKYRELMCFLYRYYACCYEKDTEQALRQALELNSLFTEPLCEDEVINATKSATTAYELWLKTFDEYMLLDEKTNIVQFFRKKGCYIYSNKKLIDLLKISQEEMHELLTIINTKEKNIRSQEYRNEWLKNYRKNNRRNDNGLTSREQAKEDKITQIEKLLNEGIKKTKIAEIVGINRSMVYKYIDEINNKKNVCKDDNEINNFELNEMFVRVDTSEVEAIVS